MFQLVLSRASICRGLSQTSSVFVDILCDYGFKCLNSLFLVVLYNNANFMLYFTIGIGILRYWRV